MALKCHALKQFGVFVSENPENLIGRIDELNNDMRDKLQHKSIAIISDIFAFYNYCIYIS